MPHRMLFATAKAAPKAATPAAGPRRAEFDALAAQLGGRLLRPGDPAYPAARRVFNPAVQTRPSAIAPCRSEAEIRACLAHVRDTGIGFRIRGGGHDFAGNSVCDGLVIDISGLDTVTMEAEDRVSVGGGCPQGSLGHVLDAAGLHLPLGDWPDVGIGGFMQGGGYGITARSFGMNLDHVEAVRVILADGRAVWADRSRNHDLWWAVRGGAGGLGVVAAIRYRARRHVRTSQAALVWKLATAEQRRQAGRALALLQSDFGRAGPDATNIFAMGAYGLDPADDSMRGPWLILSVDHVGTPHAMTTALRPLTALPGRIDGFDFARLRRNIALPALRRQSRYIARPMQPPDWTRMLDVFAEAPGRLTTLYVQAQGGAINAAPRESSAFIHRNADVLAFLDVFWEDRAARDAAHAFQSEWAATLAPFWNRRCYQNFADPALEDPNDAYWGEAFPALLATKRKYDPHGFFPAPLMAEPSGDAPPAVWPPLVVDALQQAVDR